MQGLSPETLLSPGTVTPMCFHCSFVPDLEARLKRTHLLESPGQWMPCPVVVWHVQGWWRHIPPSDCQLHFFISLLQRQCQHVEAEGLFPFSLYHRTLGCRLSRFQLGNTIPEHVRSHQGANPYRKQN